METWKEALEGSNLAYTLYSQEKGNTDIPSLRLLSDRDHPNAYKLKQAHEAFERQDLETVFSIFAEDITWIASGNNLMSGVFKGRDGVMESFQRLFSLTDSYSVYPLDYFGSDDHAVLVAHVRATRPRKTLDSSEILLCKVNEESRFSHCYDFAFDEKAWYDFFSN